MPLLVREESSGQLRSLLARDYAMFVWWGSEIECISALARRQREGRLAAQGMTVAFAGIRRLAQVWHEIDPTDALREVAVRFVRVHPLHFADALQLAAAFMAAEQRPSSLAVVTLDERLAIAARKEGFAIVDLAAAD
ncbi:MAG: type II toxin-antitoxin system VapC family toxin [Pseudomonadota bacterium]